MKQPKNPQISWKRIKLQTRISHSVTKTQENSKVKLVRAGFTFRSVASSQFPSSQVAEKQRDQTLP